MTPSMFLDLIFLAVLAAGLVIGWFKGAFRIVAGVAGTVAGFIGGRMLTPTLAPTVAGLIDPTLESWAAGIAAKIGENPMMGDALTRALEGTELMTLLKNAGMEQQFLDAVSAAAAQTATDLGAFVRSTLLEYVSSVAPIITFLLLFILIKLAVRLLCSFLSLDIPVLAQLNSMAGGAIGLAGGLLTVALVCAGIVHFGGAGDLVTLAVLEQSAIGGFFFRLFI